MVQPQKELGHGPRDLTHDSEDHRTRPKDVEASVSPQREG